jgi:hypothetical protein
MNWQLLIHFQPPNKFISLNLKNKYKKKNITTTKNIEKKYLLDFLVCSIVLSSFCSIVLKIFGTLVCCGKKFLFSYNF